MHLCDSCLFAGDCFNPHVAILDCKKYINFLDDYMKLRERVEKLEMNNNVLGTRRQI